MRGARWWTSGQPRNTINPPAVRAAALLQSGARKTTPLPSERNVVLLWHGPNYSLFCLRKSLAKLLTPALQARRLRVALLCEPTIWKCHNNVQICESMTLWIFVKKALLPLCILADTSGVILGLSRGK